jgi:hypothetical protein
VSESFTFASKVAHIVVGRVRKTEAGTLMQALAERLTHLRVCGNPDESFVWAIILSVRGRIVDHIGWEGLLR